MDYGHLAAAINNLPHPICGEDLKTLLANKDYRTARIYAIESDGLVLYVGKTVLSLKQRKSMHSAPNNRAGTRHIPPDTEWDMRLLEECSAADTKKRERWWYENLKPLYNSYTPGG
jgi:hypothetical protein